MDAALRFQEVHVRPALELVKRFAGTDYRDDWAPRDGPNYENHEAEYVANMVGQMVYDNPRVEITGTLPDVDDAAAQALDVGMNQWVGAVEFASKLQTVAQDALFLQGITCSRCEVLPGWMGQPEPLPLMPNFHRVPFTRFFQDPQGMRDDWRFMGHWWIADREDLLKAQNPDGSPTYIPQAVNALPVDTQALNRIGWSLNRLMYVERKQVVGFEVYIRESNTILTISMDAQGEGMFLRQPRTWTGHPRGPYTRYSIYDVPDQVYPLAPLSITAAMAREINAHRQQMAEDAASAKKFIIVDASKKALAEKIRRAKNGSILLIDGFNPAMAQQYETGGVQKSNAEYVAMMRGELQQRSGLSDLKRGQITGDPTATEVAEVARADDARTSYIRQRFHAAVNEELEKAGYLMLTCPEVRFPIKMDMPQPGPDGQPMLNPMTGQPVTKPMAVWFNGGMMPDEDPSMLGRIRFRAEAFSMEHVNSATKQQHAAETMQLLEGAAPLIPQTPYINWEQAFDDFGESRNIKQMGKRYLNMQMSQQIAAMQAQAAAQAAQGAPGGGPPQQGPPNGQQNGPPPKGGKPNGSQAKGQTPGARRLQKAGVG